MRAQALQSPAKTRRDLRLFYGLTRFRFLKRFPRPFLFQKTADTRRRKPLSQKVLVTS